MENEQVSVRGLENQAADPELDAKISDAVSSAVRTIDGRFKGKRPEEMVDMLSAQLNGMGIELRSVMGPDAARIDLTDRETGHVLRTDYEGPEPVMTLLSEMGVTRGVPSRSGAR